MKVLICENPGQFKYAEANYPTAKEGHAIIKIKYIGICGTDIHAFYGNQAFFTYPRILGHELAGIVEGIEENQSIKRGDSVVVIPGISCGVCIACQSGKPNCCVKIGVLGVHSDGGMCEYLSVPLGNLVRLDTIPLERAAVIEPLAIAEHAISRAGELSGKSILIMGCGPIGIGIAMLSSIKGANVHMLDSNESRLQYCLENFELRGIFSAFPESLQLTNTFTKGDMFPIVFDATGNKNAIENGHKYMSNGGYYILVGIHNGEITFNHPEIHSKEITLMSSRNAVKKDFITVMEAIQGGEINLEKYINYRLKFSELKEKMEFIANPENGVIKAVVEMD